MEEDVITTSTKPGLYCSNTDNMFAICTLMGRPASGVKHAPQTVFLHKSGLRPEGRKMERLRCPAGGLSCNAPLPPYGCE